MSLVGSEVDVLSQSDDDHDQNKTSRRTTTTAAEHPEDASSVTRIPSVDDLHPPPSPKHGFESLFLDNLETQQISAVALAQQIHQTHRTSVAGATTAFTDDFLTAADPDHLACCGNSSFSSDLDSPFGKDALALTRDTAQDYSENQYHDTMSSSTTNDTMHVDAAEKVYDTAKSVWSWGKGIPIFSPFMGLAEGVAGKVLGVAGSSLTEVDGAIEGNLHGLDDSYLNPAINAIVKAILGAAHKTEDLVKPILTTILKPVGLIKSEAENPEMTTSNPAGVTTTSTVSAN